MHFTFGHQSLRSANPATNLLKRVEDNFYKQPRARAERVSYLQLGPINSIDADVQASTNLTLHAIQTSPLVRGFAFAASLCGA